MTVLITGGAGFIGTALIRRLKEMGYDIVSYDNYSSGSKNNHVEGVEYREGDTQHINEKCDDLNCTHVFHFGEFSRINLSWEKTRELYASNLLGTAMVLEFVKRKKCKLIYSASSAPLNGNDNSTPYCWAKSKAVELINNYRMWHGINATILYFYNVYGDGQITTGKYATVMGIFYREYSLGNMLPVVYPGTQTRIFTHIDDIIDGVICVMNRDYLDVPIASKDEISIMNLAKLFSNYITILPPEVGNREKSATNVFEDVLRKHEGWECKHNVLDYIYYLKSQSE